MAMHRVLGKYTHVLLLYKHIKKASEETRAGTQLWGKASSSAPRVGNAVKADDLTADRGSWGCRHSTEMIKTLIHTLS